MSLQKFVRDHKEFALFIEKADKINGLARH